MGCITIKQWYITVQDNTASSQSINLIYSRILSIFEKMLRELVEEYHSVSKSHWDLIKRQKHLTAKLTKIQGMVKAR